jgi:hypothetical protein
MDADALKRLIDLSSLTEQEREAFLEQAPADQLHEYLRVLAMVSRVNVPAPSAAKKWDGRVELLEAVEEYHARAGRRPASFARWARIIPVGAAAGAILAASVAAAAVTDVRLTDHAMTQVLSALGIKSGGDEGPGEGPPADPGSASDAGSEPAIPGGPGSPVEDIAGGQDHAGEPAIGGGGSVGAQGVQPPGQGGENPGQGAEPPGQGGENPGQGVEPPGQGDEPPGQGVGNPGQGNQDPPRGNRP